MERVDRFHHHHHFFKAAQVCTTEIISISVRLHIYNELSYRKNDRLFHLFKHFWKEIFFHCIKEVFSESEFILIKYVTHLVEFISI